MIRVLQIITGLNWGGDTKIVLDYYRHIDRSAVQFDFAIDSTYRNSTNNVDLVNGLGGRIYYIAPKRNLLKRFSTLSSVIRQGRYRIVHIQHGSASMAVDAFIAQMCRVPVRIGHSHNTMCDCLWQHKLLKPFVNMTLTHRFACSSEAGEWLYGKRSDIVVVNNAIDTGAFAFDENVRNRIRAGFGIGDEFVIGFVGRLSHQKNLPKLAEIFGVVHKKDPSAKLLVVGDGDMKEAFIEACRRQNSFDNVIMAGRCENVNEMMMAMDSFALPSLFEGFGIVVIESQASGLRCVVSVNSPCMDLTGEGGLKKLRLDGSNGIWADALLERFPIDRASAYKKVAQAGFDLDVEAKKLEKFYIESYNKSIKR